MTLIARFKCTRPGPTFLLVIIGLNAVEAGDMSALSENQTSEASLGGDAWGFDDAGHGTRNCRHGTWDPTSKLCDCFKGWGTAHITDTVDFFEGICEQYHCESDAKCEEVLKIPGATCPVKGWNCYCGWSYAFMFEGHGYEDTHDGGGECMGVMYTFSVSMSMVLEIYFAKAWIYALAMAVCLLAFGRKRLNCDHHRPSLWNAFRNCCGFRSECPGDCVTNPKFIDQIMDEMAWSVYVLDLCMWSYLFFAAVYFVTLFIWSIVLWTAVIVITLCLLIAALCMACGAACGDGAGGSCDCGACCGDSSTMGCGDCCCPLASFHAGAGDAGATDAVFYWSGPVPYDPFWGYSGYGGYGGPPSSGGDCCDGCCSTLCRPIAIMLFYFPVMPENMWGGVVGLCMGTRTNTPADRSYQGGNSFIDFLGMGWRRRGDLHDNSSWRLQVHDFLLSEGQYADAREPLNGGPPYYSVPLDSTVGNPRQQRIGGANVIDVDRPFTEEDNCPESSFEDYKSNQCWICASERDQWDMWLSCHHLFCKDCSTQMLRRRMPCPLCRVVSTTVLRGKKSENVPGNPEAELHNNTEAAESEPRGVSDGSNHTLHYNHG